MDALCVCSSEEFGTVTSALVSRFVTLQASIKQAVISTYTLCNCLLIAITFTFGLKIRSKEAVQMETHKVISNIELANSFDFIKL